MREAMTTLCGLVGPREEAAYQRLLARGSGTADDGDMAALVDLGLAVRTGRDAEVVRPVSPSAALHLLLARRQREMVSEQQRILAGWDRLSRLSPDIPSIGTSDGVVLLTDAAEIAVWTAELCAAARHTVRAIDPEPSGALERLPARTDVRCRLIRGVTATTAEPSKVRTRARLSVRMVHVDDAVAVMKTSRTTAALVRAPAVLTALAEWFELLWEDSIPPGDAVLGEQQRRILSLMAVHDDSGVARALNVSVSTVRRQVRAIYDLLGVDSRFAAGMVAAKRGLV